VRRTKIVCTMGPACESALQEMIKAGMSVARLNMAHGDLEEHSGRIRLIREAAQAVGTPVPIMMDIKGPEVRIGTLEESSYELVKGETLTLTAEQIVGNGERIAVNYAELPSVVAPGSKILLDDGLIELQVDTIEGTEVHCIIMNGGRIKPRKGVNLPGVRTTLPGVTERDIVHIHFGIEQGIDMIAASFVRKAEDIYQIKKILEEAGASHISVISKIENEEGVENLDAIIEASDGIMVARGDLGVEIPVEDVPLIQREMIEKCNSAGKPVIVATQMLDSMQANPRPTRAEVSDVASAVLQGADAVMLSGETAAGKYPLESVMTMAQVAVRAETIFDYDGHFQKQSDAQALTITEAISQAAVSSSQQLRAKAILAPTETGFTARMLSKYRPKAPIIAIATSDAVLNRLALVWGVIPVKGERPASSDELFQSALDNGQRSGILTNGDFAVIAAGVPIGKTGATNLIKIVQV